MRAARSLHNISNLTSSQNYYISKSWNPSLSPLSPTKGAPQFFIAFLIGLGGESFFAAVRRGVNLYFFTTGHHFYNRKPRNKYILLYSTLYSTTSILLQKSLNLTPIQGFLGRLLQAALLRILEPSIIMVYGSIQIAPDERDLLPWPTSPDWQCLYWMATMCW